jgi:hypothetical protein
MVVSAYQLAQLRFRESDPTIAQRLELRCRRRALPVARRCWCSLYHNFSLITKHSSGSKALGEARILHFERFHTSAAIYTTPSAWMIIKVQGKLFV